MRKTAEDAARTRRTVLEAALFCFAEDGWDRSTLEGIGRRVGLTRGAVCHHFRDKRTLLQAVLAEGWATQSERLLAPLLDGSLPPRQRLTGFVGNYLTRLRDDPSMRALAIVTTLVAPNTRGPDDDRDDHRRGMDEWRTLLGDVLGECRLRPDVTRDHAVFGLLALVTGATLEASVDAGQLPTGSAPVAVAEAAVRGLLAEDDRRLHRTRTPRSD
ncbi:MAG: TetR/AcrR family transcriptional regulator [Actinocatenispora sp.]